MGKDVEKALSTSKEVFKVYENFLTYCKGTGEDTDARVAFNKKLDKFIEELEIKKLSDKKLANNKEEAVGGNSKEVVGNEEKSSCKYKGKVSVPSLDSKEVKRVAGLYNKGEYSECSFNNPNGNRLRNRWSCRRCTTSGKINRILL